MKRTLLLRLAFLILIPAAMALSFAANSSAAFTENMYSTKIYLYLGQPLSLITSIFPFSIAELLVIGLSLVLLYSVIISIWQLATRQSDKYIFIIKRIISLLVFCSIAYFIFITFWGINYHRLPFADIAKLRIEKASVEELGNLCEELISKANELRMNVKENNEGVMYVPGGFKDVSRRAKAGFSEAAYSIKELGGSYGNPKGILLSEALSYSGISGIYFPFTGEANVNTLTPYPLLPSTAAHEMAHQRGFAREDEANYIAYLTCSMHPDNDFKYSGALLALIYSTNSLYSYNKELYHEKIALCSDEVKRDINYISNFWKKYEGPVEKIQNKINNAYLKANMQKDGIYSYGRMVDLLLAEFKRINK